MRTIFCLCLLAAPLTFGCYQVLDPNAASGGGPDGGAADPSAMAANDQPPVDPAEAQAEGMADEDPCAVTAVQAHAILQGDCASCHEAPARQGNFDFCLETNTLTSAVASTGKPFVVAGAPEDSRLYQRVMAGEMPPAGKGPRPTTSDLSILRTWIASCLRTPSP